jgi:23S rRNA pseudouridine1911/1915/1917 synthase
MTSFELYDWTVEPDEAGQRIDKFLTETGNEWSRSQIQKWIKDGFVQVNGEGVKGNYRVTMDDEVSLRVPPPRELEVVPEAMDLDVVYEDRDVIVINKPRGMVVHPAAGHYSGTLVNGLLHHCRDLSGINGVLRPGIVHRIDKDTSGLLMVAKNDKAHLSLAQQLKEHTVTRKYMALVHGALPHQTGTIDAPLARDPKNRQQMAVVVKHGKHAITHFVLIEKFAAYSLVELKLETGRTHQIRVHMKYIGFPLVGDPKYGPKNPFAIEGQALHATVLGFRHPETDQYMEFQREIPADMKAVIGQLRIIE